MLLTDGAVALLHTPETNPQNSRFVERGDDSFDAITFSGDKSRVSNNSNRS